MTKIRPLSLGTRMRGDHNTFSNVISSFAPKDVLQGQVIWEAPANGNEVHAGDQWLHVESVNGVTTYGWVAIIHKGVPICEILPEIPDDVPDPTPVSVDVDITVTGGEVRTVRVNGSPYTK